MNVFLKLSQDEVKEQIPYMLICETMESSVWGTGRRRRRMREEFTAYERERIYGMKAQAHRWALKTGVPPEGIMMSVKTLGLWQRLAAFCASL